jgi:RNA 2',3'-cyclic 3'-phosphodiesterase
MPPAGSARPARLRLFIAIDVPEEVRALVGEAVAPWRERFPGGRWVPIENWHVTLTFLGSTPPDLVGWISSRLAEVAGATRPFGSRVEGLGAFRSPGRARVLWAGLLDDDGAMARLASELGVVLEAELTPERRGFTPHLTVARFDPPAELGEELGRLVVRSQPFAVDRITLYRSHLRRPSPVYEPVAVFPLTG